MNTKPIFSSARHNWKTPEAFYNDLDSEFCFDFDPCPTDPTFDGLEREWGTRNFLNPPYNQIKKWLQKHWSSVIKERPQSHCCHPELAQIGSMNAYSHTQPRYDSYEADYNSMDAASTHRSIVL